MALLVLAALLPPTPTSTAVLDTSQTREQLLVPEVHVLAGGIVDESQTSLCMCLGCDAGQKMGQHPLAQSSRERPQLLGALKSLEGVVLGTLMLVRDSSC